MPLSFLPCGARAPWLTAALCLLLAAGPARADAPAAGAATADAAPAAGDPQGAPLRYTAAYFFGASNLDTGNWQSHPFWSLDANAPRPANGYWRWRWQSGPVWAEYFAQSLGLTAAASASGGSNYAFGAAGTSPHPGETPAAPGTPGHALYLSTQVDQALADHPAGLDPKAIYVFAIGDNDPVLFGRTPAQAPTAAGVVIAQMQRLRVAGARRFLVRTLPPGQDPYASPFNAALRQGLPALRAAGAKAYVVDAAQFVAGYLTVPYLASIGITQFGPGVNCRSNAACQAAAATAALADQVHDHAFLFFDGLGPHFNHRVHREIADHALLQLPLFENGFD
jgi:phospholipase/lecithinase/hemolysin